MEDQFPTPFQRKTLWKALTGLAITTLGILLVGLIWLVGNVLSYLQPVLIPLAIAGIVAYLLDPAVSWLQRKGLSRLRSVLVVFFSFLMGILLMGWIVIPPIVQQVSDLLDDKERLGDKVSKTLHDLGEIGWIKPGVQWALAEHVEEGNGNGKNGEAAVKKDEPSPKQTPEDTESLEGSEESLLDEVVAPDVAPPFQDTNLAHYLSSNTERIAGTVSKLITSGTSTILSTLGLILGLAMVPIYLYYFLKESSSIKAHWHDYVPLKASEFKNEVVDTLQEINGYLISFFRGQMLVAFIDGILVGIALMIFGLPYALVIGLAMAILGVIPYIGNIICLVPACMIAYVHFAFPENRGMLEGVLGSNQWAYVAATVAIFVIVQQINSLVTAPKIVGDSVGLHPMTVIFSMLFWSLLLGGFLGALLAVPMTASVKVLFRRYIWERKMSPSAVDGPPPEEDLDESTATA
ncbi:putative transport protein Rv0205 [Rubritalea halochordaticola]|uniref:Transport protein Rv0205 n=1 Tax=Rubritalea halochordaticola TaxID=714537 RepID=A0ABP9V1A5_9BACT